MMSKVLNSFVMNGTEGAKIGREGKWKKGEEERNRERKGKVDDATLSQEKKMEKEVID